MADLETPEAPAANEAALNFQTQTTGTEIRRRLRVPRDADRYSSISAVGSTPLLTATEEVLVARRSSRRRRRAIE